MRANIDVGTGAAALFFDFGEVEALVPVGFRVVVVGDGVEARGFGRARGDDGVGHAHDGGRVHAAAKLGEDGPVGAKPAADGFAENGAKVLFVLGVSVVTDSLVWIEFPIFADGVVFRSYNY